MDFTKLEFILKEAAENVPAVTIKYGNFIQAMVYFTIIAFIIFMVVKLINNLKKKEQAAPETAPEPSKEELLLTEIRDLLKERK